MVIDWEEILDAEGEDMAEAYDDAIPQDEAEPAPDGYYNTDCEPEEEPDDCEDDLAIKGFEVEEETKDRIRKEAAKADIIPAQEFGDDDMSEEDLELFK